MIAPYSIDLYVPDNSGPAASKAILKYVGYGKSLTSLCTFWPLGVKPFWGDWGNGQWRI